MEPPQFSNLVNIYEQFMLFKIANYVKIVVFFKKKELFHPKILDFMQTDMLLLLLSA